MVQINNVSKDNKYRRDFAFNDPSIDEAANTEVDDSEEIIIKLNEKDDFSENAEQKHKYFASKAESKSKKNKVIADTINDYKGGYSLKNKWFNLDIETDIPPQKQMLIRRSLFLYATTVIALTLNLITLILVASLSKGVVILPMNNVVLGLFALFFGVVIEWGFFKCLYNYIKDGKRIMLIAYWIVFSLHCVYILYSIIGLPNNATSGVFNLIIQLGPGGSWAVILFDILTILAWCFVAVLTLVIGKTVHSNTDIETSPSNNSSLSIFKSMIVDV